MPKSVARSVVSRSVRKVSRTESVAPISSTAKRILSLDPKAQFIKEHVEPATDRHIVEVAHDTKRHGRVLVKWVVFTEGYMQRLIKRYPRLRYPRLAIRRFPREVKRFPRLPGVRVGKKKKGG